MFPKFSRRGMGKVVGEREGVVKEGTRSLESDRATHETSAKLERGFLCGCCQGGKMMEFKGMGPHRRGVRCMGTVSYSLETSCLVRGSLWKKSRGKAGKRQPLGERLRQKKDRTTAKELHSRTRGLRKLRRKRRVARS